MKPRWARSSAASAASRTAITERIPAVSPAGGATGPSVPRPRTLRIPAVPGRGLRSMRLVHAAEALQLGLDHGFHPAWTRLRPLLGSAALAAGIEKTAMYALDDALRALGDAHARYEIHRDGPCLRCTPGELCPWHYARLRSWWDARDRAATLLVARIDDALAGREMR